MKHRVTVYTWVLAITMVTLYVCGMAVGYSLGVHTRTQADTCTGWSGRWIHISNCDGQQCSGFSFGPFYTSQCNDTYVPQQGYPSEVLG